MPFSSSSSSSSNDDDVTIKPSDERTPLLAQVTPIPTSEPIEASIQTPEAGNTQNDDEDVPLPRLQIFLLCYSRVIEPIAFFCIFPYINSMIETKGGIDTKKVGFYSGLIESLFSATQMCVMIFWGRASDKYGRKPCLVISLLGITASTALFGMSTTILQMIVFRCLAGAFAGTVVTVRTMISENSTKKTQARAFSYFAFATNLGIFFGPLIGGAFENPAKKISAFDRIPFFREYPYALPGFVSACFGLSGAILTALFVRETLPADDQKRKSADSQLSTWELIRYPGVAPVLLIYNYTAILAFSFTAVDPVFLFTPVEFGGIGFKPSLIAAAIALNGVSQAIWLLGLFPRLQHRTGTGGVLRLCAWAWPFFFAVHPICNWFLRHDLKAAFWTVGSVCIVVGSGVAMAFTGVQLALNDISPSHETLGTLNAVALSMSSGLRAFIPALSTATFAIGVNYNIADGQLFWIVDVIIAAGFIGVLKYLPEKAEGKIRNEENREE